jgi:hypothetical protein
MVLIHRTVLVTISLEKPNPTGTGIILYGRNGEGRVRNGPAFSVFEDFCQ